MELWRPADRLRGAVAFAFMAAAQSPPPAISSAFPRPQHHR